MSKICFNENIRRSALGFKYLILTTAILIGAFSLNSLAYSPPVPIQVTQANDQVTGLTKYTYTVFDPQRNQSFSGNSGFGLNSDLVYLDGTVAWLTTLPNTYGSASAYRVNYVVWDPSVGFRQNSETTSFGIRYAGGLRTAKGIVFWLWDNGSTFPQQYRVTYKMAAYNPIPTQRTWQSTGREMSSYIDGTGSARPEAAFLGDGVVAWAYNEGNASIGFGSKFLYSYAFDAAVGGWIFGVTSSTESGVNSYQVVSITNSTVNYRIGASNLNRGYGRGGWFAGTTAAIAEIAPSQSSGQAPLTVVFWDISLGASNWNWTFGDGGSAAISTPTHTYNSPGTTYSTSLTVTGPGGGSTRSASIVTNPLFATVSGKVVSPTGQALRSITVIMTDSAGITRTATTSSFGLFSFDNVATAQTYIFTVDSKRYRFTPQTVLISNDVTLPDFVALE